MTHQNQDNTVSPSPSDAVGRARGHKNETAAAGGQNMGTRAGSNTRGVAPEQHARVSSRARKKQE